MNQNTAAHVIKPLRIAATAAVIAFVTMLSLVPAAGAALPTDGSGNYTQMLCANPATGEGLGLSGMPEGLTNPSSSILWQVTSSEVDCAAGRITRSRGVPMLVGQSNTYGQGTWAALLYQAPANVTINAGTIYRAEKAEGANAGYMGIIQQGGEYNNLYSLPRNCCDQGDWLVGNVASRGTFTEPFSPENVVNLTISPDGGHWDVNATCDPNGNNNSSCTLATDQWEYRIFAGEISLHASNDPQASNVSGPLTSDNPVKGNESLTFSATDQGPGLAYIKMLVDGNTVQSQIIDTNSGRCIPIPGRDAYTWAYQMPCKTSLGGRTYTLDTTSLPNGAHHLQVVIEDAAGNRSTVMDRTVNVENPTNSTLGTLPGPGSNVLIPGAPSATSQSTSANSISVGVVGQMRLGLARRITRPFARSALRLPGRLLDVHGRPIAGATLDVVQRIEGSTNTQVIAHTKTKPNGTFIAKVPAGPSRLITIAYRATPPGTGYAAQATVQEIVGAGLQLRVSPHRTSATGTITLSGRVMGPIPRHGIVVDLLVHYRGRWAPFRTPYTNSKGRFRVAYQFQGAHGRFPFRALTYGGQSGFPYSTGQSNAVDVTAR